MMLQGWKVFFYGAVIIYTIGRMERQQANYTGQKDNETWRDIYVFVSKHHKTII